jgi:hypothetical protein
MPVQVMVAELREGESSRPCCKSVNEGVRSLTNKLRNIYQGELSIIPYLLSEGTVLWVYYLSSFQHSAEQVEWKISSING